MRPELTEKQRKAKNAYLLKNYHITYEGYEALRKHQDYKCAICRKAENTFKTALAVDHDHITGETRGLLCWRCNRALGKFGDSIELVQRAAAYVTTPPLFILTGIRVFTAPGRIGTASRRKAIAKMNGTQPPKRRKRAKRKPRARSAKRTIKI